jgi:hypothetical protein
MLLSIETSALNRAAKASDGLETLRALSNDAGLRPAIGTHTIYELSKLLWDDRHFDLRCRLFQLVLDLDPAFLVPADRLLESELRRLQLGEAVIPFMLGADLAATKRVVTGLAAGETNAKAIEFTKHREQAIARNREEDQQHVDRLQRARLHGELPNFKTFQQLLDYHHNDIADLIQRRFQGRINADDARRFAQRLDQFPALRTAVRADLHFMFIRAATAQVPSRDKTADYRHVVDASYCAAIVIDDKKLLRKVALLNPQLRAIAWPIDGDDRSEVSRGLQSASGATASKPLQRHRQPQPKTECIYCRSITSPTKREHVMSQALGTFEQNWTLDCVCDECNKFFADNLELALGRDSREALLRIELGLKPASGASELLNRRIRTTLQDPGQFDGIRLVIRPTEDLSEVVPVPVPQVGLRLDGQEWCFLIERELTEENLARFRGETTVQIRIHGVGEDCSRLRMRLEELGIPFTETYRLMQQPITEQSAINVIYDIHNDETIVRAACKIGFNYAAKVLGAETVLRPSFDTARRFVRYGEAPVRIATAQQRSVLTGPDAQSARVHACGIGWDRGYLCVLISLFNELTYGLRLSEAGQTEFRATQHFFDPVTRTISEASVG